MGVDPDTSSEAVRGAAPAPRRRRASLAVPVLVLLVLVVGLVTRGRPEVYPFAQWAMFSRVPATLDVWTLRIHEVDGQRFPDAPLVHDVPALAGPFDDSGAHARVDGYGRALLAVQNGHEERRAELDRLRRRTERLFGDHEVTYSVVNLRGDPMDLLEGGDPDRVVDLGRHSTR